MTHMDPRKLRDFIDYDPETGSMTWKPRGLPKWDAKWSGKEAFGSRDAYGYRQSSIQGVTYKGHRVAYAYVYGLWPNGPIDHINGQRDDNRILNLRVATESENRRNMRPRRAGLALGVYREGPKWRACIKVGGRQKRLGVFARYEDAVAARKVAERELGFHPNHGCDVTDLRREAEAA